VDPFVACAIGSCAYSVDDPEVLETAIQLRATCVRDFGGLPGSKAPRHTFCIFFLETLLP
jgi:hypothetical protein